jgi:hypothetical protein
MVVYDQALLDSVMTQVLLAFFEERDQQFHVGFVNVRAGLVRDGGEGVASRLSPPAPPVPP